MQFIEAVECRCPIYSSWRLVHCRGLFQSQLCQTIVSLSRTSWQSRLLSDIILWSTFGQTLP